MGYVTLPDANGNLRSTVILMVVIIFNSNVGVYELERLLTGAIGSLVASSGHGGASAWVTVMFWDDGRKAARSIMMTLGDTS